VGTNIILTEGSQGASLKTNESGGYIQLDVGGSGHSNDDIYIGDVSSGTNKVIMSGDVEIGLTATATTFTDGTATLTGGVLSGTTSIAGTLTTAAQPNITSLGTLTSLAVTGDLTIDSNTLFVDASTNTVGINNVSPDSSYSLEISGNSILHSAKAITLESGNFEGGNTTDIFINKNDYGFNQSEFHMYNQNNNTASQRYFRMDYSDNTDDGSTGLDIKKDGSVRVNSDLIVGDSITVTTGDLTLSTGDLSVEGGEIEVSGTTSPDILFDSTATTEGTIARFLFNNEGSLRAGLSTLLTDYSNGYSKYIFYTKDTDGFGDRLKLERDANIIYGDSTVEGGLTIEDTQAGDYMTGLHLQNKSDTAGTGICACFAAE
jgi:hypothetical protein